MMRGIKQQRPQKFRQFTFSILKSYTARGNTPKGGSSPRAVASPPTSTKDEELIEARNKLRQEVNRARNLSIMRRLNGGV